MVRVTKPEKPKGSLSGRITGFLDRPVSGAEVTLNGMKTYSKPDGTYEFTDVDVGRYTFTVSASLYKIHSQTVEIKEGRNTKDVKLSLSDMVKLSLALTGIFGAIGAYSALRK